DARAPKLVELRADPRAAVHIYDARAKIQLRLSTRAMLHPDGDLKAEAWQATRPFSRECYRVIPSPGDSVTDPEAVPFQATDDTEAGLENFVPVTLQVTVLEWLFLAHQGHRRARFTWAEDGTLSQDWLVP
ncbi:MAG: pyridoxamine 5'-phosphate oxidase, partial [Devosiaceae bacterium]|nr:pyridoxamine 5'-phosphate oxidase [Devosiaceae bacterium MH13]